MLNDIFFYFAKLQLSFIHRNHKFYDNYYDWAFSELHFI